MKNSLLNKGIFFGKNLTMGDFLDYFKNKKNLANLLVLGILVLALPLGINLVRQQQIIKSRAAQEQDAIKFTGNNVITKNGQLVATDPQVTLEFTSPLGPAPQGGVSSQTAQVQGAFMSRAPRGLVRIANAQEECDPSVWDPNTWSYEGIFCDPGNPGNKGEKWTCQGTVQFVSDVADTDMCPLDCDPNGSIDPNTWNYEGIFCDPGNPGNKGERWSCQGTKKFSNDVKDTVMCPISSIPPSASPSTPAGACSVTNWSFSPSSPQAGGSVRVSATGNTAASWQNVAYKLDNGAWITQNLSVQVGPPPVFTFTLNSVSAGSHTVLLAQNSGASVCSGSGSFSTSGSGGQCDLGTNTFGMTDACSTCIIAQTPQQNPNTTLVDVIKSLGTQNGQKWGGCTNTQLVGKWCSDINKSVCTSIKTGSACVPVCSGVSAVSCSTFSPNGLSDSGQLGPGGIKIYNTPDYKGGRRLLNVTSIPSNATVNPSSTKDPATADDIAFEKAADGSGKWLANIPDNNTSSDVNYTLVAGVASGGETANCTPFMIRLPKKPGDIGCTSDITSTQARLRSSESDSWTTDLSIILGESIFVAGFHNNQTDQLAEDIILTATGPEGPSSHVVTLNNNDNNVSYIPLQAGKYTITATTVGKTGSTCTGSATLTVRPVPVTTVSFRYAESLADLDGATWLNYTGTPMTVNYQFIDANPGVKTIFVEFKDSAGKEGGCGPNGDQHCQKQIRLLGSDPTITNCSINFEGTTAVLNINGQHFGSTQASIKSGVTNLQIREWKNNSIVAGFANAPAGQILPVAITNSDGQTGEGQCGAISVLSFGAKMFCKSQLTSDLDNVELKVAGLFQGGKLVKQKVKIDKDGVIQGLTERLEAGKQYKLSVKAPFSLRKTTAPFTAGGGVTNIANFLLPVGDIFPADSGDGAINSLDKAELNRQWIIASAGTGRTGDFNRDGRVNSIDWACMRYEFGKTDDPEPVPGIPAPSGSPNPDSSASPNPTQSTLPTTSPTASGTANPTASSTASPTNNINSNSNSLPYWRR